MRVEGVRENPSELVVKKKKNDEILGLKVNGECVER